jgi:Fur family transcriptional regulator, ferric uptake regulator
MPAKTNPPFLTFLKEHGLKWTSGREEVFREAVATEGHFEPEELAYRLRKRGSRISKATVYRTLPLLIKAGLIKEVIHGEKHHHYEHIHEEKDHDHLICLRCGKIIEFEEESLREIEGRICKKHAFRPERILVEIFGYCKECR